MVDSVLSHPKGAYRWQKKYDPAIIEYIPELYEGGRTDVEVAVDIGISESNFYEWMKQYPAFADAVRYGKSISKKAMSEIGLEGAKGDRKIDGKVWHIMMRNCHGYDKEHTETVTKQDLKEHGEKMEKMIKSNERDY